MSLYTVTSIPLAAIPNVHEGTGTHQSSNWLSSLPLCREAANFSSLATGCR